MSTDPTFQMIVEDIFMIRGRGIVVVGLIKIGVLKVGDKVIIKRQMEDKEAEVTGIEMFGKKSKEAKAGEKVGVLLKGISENEIQPGDRLAGSGMDYSWNF